MPGKRVDGIHESSSVIGSLPASRSRSIRTAGAPTSRPSAAATCSGAVAGPARRTRAWACRPARAICSVKPATSCRRTSTLPAATNVPRPTPRSTRPRADSASRACRIVPRLTRSSSASSRSAGRRSPTSSSPVAMRAASDSSIWAQTGTDESRCSRRRIGPDQYHGAPLASKGPLRVPSRPMRLEELKADVERGAVDTVVLALCDMQGRLQGKRMSAQHFLAEIAEHGAEACNYLLAVDVEMNTVGGYAMSSWERGYGDFEMRPDLDTLRITPWHPGTALCLSDLHWIAGGPVVASPRQILRAQLDRLAERGWQAFAGTELEFIVFRDSYEDGWTSGYRDMTPANLYNVDYSLIGTSRVEPLIRRIRNEMAAANMKVEDSKGECNFGQHEINFRYGPALRAADEHVIYKNGAKEIAARAGKAITFMAKYDEREGNSCHIHLSLRDGDGNALFGSDDDATLERFMAGVLATLRELTLLLAPNVNSYKRFAVGSFAPTAVAWGVDNRTCALRVVGHGASRRLECRLPGADVNPYLAIGALIAGGLHGIDHGLPLEPSCEGNAYLSDKPRVPSTLRDASELFGASPVAREAFGDEVVAHYLNNARVELDGFESAVTDWERYRGFERL